MQVWVRIAGTTSPTMIQLPDLDLPFLLGQSTLVMEQMIEFSGGYLMMGYEDPLDEQHLPYSRNAHVMAVDKDFRQIWERSFGSYSNKEVAISAQESAGVIHVLAYQLDQDRKCHLLSYKLDLDGNSIE